MVGPKMQDFCPRINMLKGIFLKQRYNVLWFVKKCLKSYFQGQFSLINFQGFSPTYMVIWTLWLFGTLEYYSVTPMIDLPPPGY